ncbi:hypothetical protein [Brevibacillus choshinensis]|uniref:hypothetical protein n=1 Tax=Brevibacillus choshinensis TaxID=54911 RepID=UPI002E212D05|nr:hypothetical protein [Brevibacillus choshinensis]MED4751920.1 hypothetical protein [Brevibacillus choshinensis]MED4784333.1 hypothetical protein [Brevibacillus choshinensis]
MKTMIPAIARVLLGLILLGAGLNGYLVIFGYTPLFPTSPAAMALLQGYLLVLVKSTEVICALLLLTNRWVPLTLTIVAPISVNILAFHLFVDRDLLPLGLLVAVLVVLLLWSYRRYFLGLLAPSAPISPERNIVS